MANTTPLLMQILKKIAPRSCHSCSTQFRGGRRKHIECSLTVCNKCYYQYSDSVRLQPIFDESEEMDNTSDMDFDLTISDEPKIDHYRDAESQTDFVVPPNTLCSSCTSSNTSIRSSMLINPINCLSLLFHRVPKSTRKCFACNIYFSGNSVRVPDSARIHGFLNENIFIPSDSYTCEKHLAEGILKPSMMTIIKNNHVNTCEIKITELMEILETIKNELNMLNLKNNELLKQPPINIDNSYRFTSNEYHILTGLYREQFDELCSIIPTSVIYNTVLRSARQAIACLLTKLRLGLSHETLAILFSLPNPKAVTRVLESARLALMRYFVPNNLGFQHISRDEVIRERTRPLAKALLADNQDKVCAVIFLFITHKSIS
jgi:hypothetical protein